MSTAIDTTAAPVARPDTQTPRSAMHRIPLTRLVGVELSKMFDTRSGFWLMCSIGILAFLATAAVIAFAPDEAIAYGTFAPAIGIPMAVILPVIAILSVTSEYGQRTALTTYTLVPRRGRVIGAKAIAALIIGVVGMVIATAVGALGNVVGAAIKGVDQVWEFSWIGLSYVILGNLLGMAVGFMLGVIIRNSPGAIVAYFVYAFVLPGIFGTLAQFQDWFFDIRPWVDVNFNINFLFMDMMDSDVWANLGVTSLIWIFIPMAFGVRKVLTSEVK